VKHKFWCPSIVLKILCLPFPLLGIGRVSLKYIFYDPIFTYENLHIDNLFKRCQPLKDFCFRPTLCIVIGPLVISI